MKEKFGPFVVQRRAVIRIEGDRGRKESYFSDMRPFYSFYARTRTSIGNMRWRVSFEEFPVGDTRENYLFLPAVHQAISGSCSGIVIAVSATDH